MLYSIDRGMPLSCPLLPLCVMVAQISALLCAGQWRGIRGLNLKVVALNRNGRRRRRSARALEELRAIRGNSTGFTF